MSGRLKILGKKSYCPWKADNLSRVRHDEQEQRDRQRRAKEREETAVREKRWEALGAAKHASDRGHVNLFEKEENDATLMRRPAVNAATTTKQGRATEEEVPFYLKKDPFATVARDDKSKSQERTRRKKLDPMSRYHPEQYNRKTDVDEDSACSDEDQGKGRRRRKTKKRASGSSSSKSDDDDDSQRRRKKRKRIKHEKRAKDRNRDTKAASASSMQELRQRRIDRERQEKERQQKLSGKS